MLQPAAVPPLMPPQLLRYCPVLRIDSRLAHVAQVMDPRESLKVPETQAAQMVDASASLKVPSAQS